MFGVRDLTAASVASVPILRVEDWGCQTFAVPTGDRHRWDRLLEMRLVAIAPLLLPLSGGGLLSLGSCTGIGYLFSLSFGGLAGARF